MNKVDKKAVIAVVKMQVPAGKATPAPPVGSQLGKHGIKLMDFCKSFNALTSQIEPGAPVPLVISICLDKSFSFVTKSLPTSYLLRKAAYAKGKKLFITEESLEQIYQEKKTDMTAYSKESAYGSILGTAKSMGIELLKV